MAKIRTCPSCGFEWTSETFFDKRHNTKCPKCGQPVPGGSSKEMK